jgi:prolyl oligopeptidase
MRHRFAPWAPLRTLLLFLTLVLGGRALAQEDPYLWLEDVHGARATAWVKAENAKTAAVLEADPRFGDFLAQGVALAEAKDRTPEPILLGGAVYNFWRDAAHVRGLLRRTSLSSYLTADPRWTSVLDLDALSAAEGANFVMKGETCEPVRERRCLISLSDGGEDAVVVREFDLAQKAFVPSGFVLPKGKQSAAYASEDEILISREWSPGETTTSGYPFIVKRLKRGQPLADAVEVFRGAKEDGGYGVRPLVLADGDGQRVALILRPLSTFEAETYILGPKGPRRLAIPLKSRPEALVKGRLIVAVNEAWSAGGTSAPAGALVSLDLAAALRRPQDLRPEVILSPGPRQSLEGAVATKGRLVVAAMDNVRGRAFLETPRPGGGWRRADLTVPDNASIALVDADPHGEHAFLEASGFLKPPSTLLLDAATGALTTAKVLPARFDAAKAEVEQFEAVSTDGTKIPYFIVHPKAMKLDGSNPTILTAYGGFQVSMTPRYLPDVGKLWIERGGTYVLANIRGGGEFGPAWHEAGLKTKRQIIYDDFRCVAEDLIRRGVTSPRRLGIEGGSNGGLLMGVEFTQHPELWRAVDIQVPLLDMLRFESIAAGSSWVGEYGSVSSPAERAFLEKISPYANLKRGVVYPEPFIWTTTKDDRVGPQHARKFAARLAEFGDPYLFYEVTEGGHGAGANLKETAKTKALEMTYFTQKLVD